MTEKPKSLAKIGVGLNKSPTKAAFWFISLFKILYYL